MKKAPAAPKGKQSIESNKSTFMQGFASVLAKRKAIIDGDIEGDLSVKATRDQEVAKLGVEATIIPGVDTPAAPGAVSANNPSGPPAMPMMPPPVMNKNPDEMTMAEKRAMLSGIMGGPPVVMAPKPAVQETPDASMPPPMAMPGLP